MTYLLISIGRLGPIDAVRRRLVERKSAGSFRIDPGRSGFLAMAVVAVLVTGGVGCWVLAARPHRIPVSASADSVSASRSDGIAAGGSLSSPLVKPSVSRSAVAAVVVVDVVGRVHHPGIYRLPQGSRVDDAVTAAGGTLSGVDPVTLNLARKLTDGEQLVVGLVGAVPAAGNPVGSAAAGAGALTGGTGGPIDLNSATAAQLDALPGVGPVLAQRIVDWRSQHGRFDSIDQLRDVSGIGESKYADLKSLVTVGG